MANDLSQPPHTAANARLLGLVRESVLAPLQDAFADVVDGLFQAVLANEGYQLTIDLDKQTIAKPDGSTLAFEVQAFRKYCLLNGFDDIGLTLQHADKIKAFEEKRLAQKPWLAHTAA